MALMSFWAKLFVANFNLRTGKWSPLHKQSVRGHFWPFGLEILQEHPHDTDNVFGVVHGHVVGVDVGADGPVAVVVAVLVFGDLGIGLGLYRAPGAIWKPFFSSRHVEIWHGLAHGEDNILD